MYNNEYVEYWGRMDIVTRVFNEGITFRVFLGDPAGWLGTVARPSAPESWVVAYRPLLPRQRRVAQRLWQRWEREAN